ncbi:MAG: iron-containing alcohol dehydrogenase [Solirubrobacteraceae bacterium]|nr:iron-containing alcohol dehydrogenase [Solirubrobacteraceae bacterium]
MDVEGGRTGFRHQDVDRTIVFGEGAVDRAADLLADPYVLLTTARALRARPDLADGATRTVEVPPGAVPGLAAELRGTVDGERIVAFGGGRVVDVAKAIAAADPPRTVIAIPTTLSGAQMTGTHRHATGVDEATPRARAAVVVDDPALSASQDRPDLAASAGNAFGHVVATLGSDGASPIVRAVAREAGVRLAGPWHDDAIDRAGVALGALLAGWALDHAGLGLHHVVAQTAVREGGLAHATANVAVLAGTAAAARRRRPRELARLDVAMGVRAEDLARALRRGARLGRLDVFADEERRAGLVAAAARRPELRRMAEPPDAAELDAIYRAAWNPAAARS